MTCAFFGHKDSPDSIRSLPEKEVRRLIEYEGYDEFLVGNQGRFAISRRNKWIVDNSNAVICYISHTWAGAYQAVSLAERKKLSVFNLA